MFELAYTAAGPEDGRPAILLHGLFDHWRSFAPVLERLPAGVRAYALTQRGHTGGPQPDPADGWVASGDLVWTR